MQEEASTLYAVLSDGDANAIRPIIQSAVSLGAVSANQLLAQLSTKGTSSPLFKPLHDFLAIVEGIKYTTYKDSKGNMSIGIGLNIANSDAAALFYALDPNRNWGFPNMQKTEGLPNPPLTDTQINQLLCLTLTGVSNSQGTFEGETARLINRFKALNYTYLADTPFAFYQLIALQSLAFNLPVLIGAGICKALTEISKYGDVPVLMQYIDYSNAEKEAGAQNRRLRDAAMFHGNVTDPVLDVHLTWRQYQHILNDPNNNIRLVGGPVKWGIPKGIDQEDFEGYSDIVIIPNQSDKYDEPAYFGTPNNDIFIYKSQKESSSPIFFGGNGDDQIFINGSIVENSYLAGGLGNDLYRVSSSSGIVYIYDEDRNGKIMLDNNIMIECDIEFRLPYYLAGVIINNKISFCGSEYDTILLRETDNTDTLQISFTSPYAASLNINIGNFKSPQFGIIADAIKYKADIPNFYSSNVFGFTINGKLGIQSPDNPEIFIVYDLTGNITNKFTIKNFSDNSLKFQNFIATLGDMFYACALQFFSNSSTTISNLLSAYIDQNSHNVRLETIASLNCPSDSDCYEFSSVYPVALTTGSVALITCLSSQTKNLLAAYINGNQKIISDNSSCGTNGWAVHKGGFLISTPNPSNNSNNMVVCDMNGTPYQRFSIPHLISYISITPLSNGYVMAINSGENLYTKMYKENQGWLTDLIIGSNYQLSGLFSYSLPQDNVLIVIPFNDVDTEYLILNSNNMPFTQIFSLTNQLNGFIASAPQKNGDIYIFYYDKNNEPPSLYNIYLPASGFGKSLYLKEAVLSIQKKILTNQTELITTKPHTQNQFFSTLTGIWDGSIKQDPHTGKPIFTYRVYDENHQEIGSAEFYGHPLLCRSEDGQRHNLISTTGVLSQFNITDNTSIEEICEVLPPTLFDKVLTSAQQGAIHGSLRGGSNLIGFTLKSVGVSQKISACISEFIYYGSYFTWHFFAYHEQFQTQNETVRSFNALYAAAIETGQIFIANTVLSAASNLLHKAGETVENRSWSVSGKILKAGGALMRFGIFARNAVQQGIIETTAAVAAGAVTETVIDYPGKALVNYMRHR